MIITIVTRRDFERYNNFVRIERRNLRFDYCHDTLVINGKEYNSYKGSYYQVDKIGFAVGVNVHAMRSQHIATIRRQAYWYNSVADKQSVSKCLHDAKAYMQYMQTVTRFF